MSNLIPVSVQWLALREDADARSRSRALASRAAHGMRAPLVVHDLGSGTGSMMHWLAALLPAPQTWVLHDWNPDLLGHAAERAAVDSTGRHVAVTTSVKDVAHLRNGDLTGASLVTMSALLDVLSRDEIEAVVRACVAAGAPVLFTLSVTGRVSFDPVDPGDRVFESAFNDHQRRAADGRRLLGPDAGATAIGLFESAGWAVEVAETPWLLDAADRPLLDEWLEGWVAAAVEERPALEEWGDEYFRRRAAQLANGTLKVVIDHQDFLAWPP